MKVLFALFFVTTPQAYLITYISNNHVVSQYL